MNAWKRPFTLVALSGALIAGALFSACPIASLDDPGALVPATVDEDPALPCLDINGTRLHLESYGDPESDTMLFFHGGPGDSMEYMRPLIAMSDRFQCVFFDQRGTGRSRREPIASYREFIDSYLGDMDALVRLYSRPGKRLILVGHSWGGQYIAWYLSLHPDAPVQAVLADPGPLTSAMFREMGLKTAFDPARLSDYMDINRICSPGSHCRLDYSMKLAAGSIKAFERYHLSPTAVVANQRMGGLVIMRSSASGAAFDATANLDLVTARLVFIRSGLNEVHTEAYMRTYMGYFPNADLRYATIPGVGHDMIQVKPDEFGQAILDNLR
jgi:proline iminopeptidase